MRKNTITISESSFEIFTITPRLRYAKKLIVINEFTVKEELMLQQMWQGSKGAEKWEWVEVFEE